MIKNKLQIAILILLAAASGCSKDSNSPTENNNLGTIKGKITDRSSGIGISGVNIATNPVTAAAATNQAGDYILTNIEPGDYQVTAAKPGYYSLSASVTVKIDSTAVVNIILTAISPAPSPPLLISPASGSVNISVPPTLTWNSSDNSYTYNLQISKTTTFSDTVVSKTGITGTSLETAGLDYAAVYYWRVNASNGYETSGWSEIGSFTTAQFICGQQVKYEGSFYNTIQIGTQCWFKENLNAGTMIMNAVPIPSDNGVIEKYCYDDKPFNCNTYGGLYLWNEAMNYSMEPGVKGICPTGWHIPSKEEFDILISAVNNDGNSLKTEGSGFDDGVGNNTTGFSAILAGHGHISGTCNEMGWTSFMWSSTFYSIPNVYYLQLTANDSSVKTPYEQRTMAFSVRCLKN